VSWIAPHLLLLFGGEEIRGNRPMMSAFRALKTGFLRIEAGIAVPVGLIAGGKFSRFAYGYPEVGIYRFDIVELSAATPRAGGNGILCHFVSFSKRVFPGFRLRTLKLIPGIGAWRFLIPVILSFV